VEEAKKILIIEDEAEIRDSLCQLLEFEGYQSFGVSNGREALENLEKNHKPCLILLDLMMPVMDGWEFLNIIKGKPELSDIPVLVISALDKASEVKGVAGIIRKPFDISQLTKMVSRYCGPPATASYA